MTTLLKFKLLIPCLNRISTLLTEGLVLFPKDGVALIFSQINIIFVSLIITVSTWIKQMCIGTDEIEIVYITTTPHIKIGHL